MFRKNDKHHFLNDFILNFFTIFCIKLKKQEKYDLFSWRHGNTVSFCKSKNIKNGQDIDTNLML